MTKYVYICDENTAFIRLWPFFLIMRLLTRPTKFRSEDYMSFENDFGEETEPKFHQDISGSHLFLLSLTSAAVYLLLALLIYHSFYESGIAIAFDHGFSINNQILTGIVSGCIGAGIIGFVISRPPVSGILHDFYIVEAISKMNFSNFDRIQLSFFAGAGEELLFRGAIQPLLGIWITSLIFVGLHGYFKFKSTGHIAFGVMMFALSVGLGYIYEEAGLIAAMAAHAVYDIIMLKVVETGDTGKLIN